jgi:hypothetical protein
VVAAISADCISVSIIAAESIFLKLEYVAISILRL